jgi:hypothetical protein
MPKSSPRSTRTHTYTRVLQWAIELDKPQPPTSATALVEKGKTLLKDELKRELERRGLDTTGLKSTLEARLEEVI